ncbi:MAG: C40 family peptidase [Bacteroidota bacterium]|nr:C40 family peptidase [Bacteroidota bacterium]
MEYAICTVAAAPVRKEPSHKTEMTNQLLFGETMKILETKEEWFRVKSLYDNYEGWLTYHLIDEVEKDVASEPLQFICADLINSIQFADQVINAPMGAALTGFNKESGKLWNDQYSFDGMFRNFEQPSNEEELLQTAKKWLNAPYLWGGKTFLGVDCSGFVQTVFKVHGIRLSRDAWQQVKEGEAVEKLSFAKTGDVAFFNNPEGRITHVGILLNRNQIIHASGKVRIDKIDEEGIINIRADKRTHQLHSMKRFF